MVYCKTTVQQLQAHPYAEPCYYRGTKSFYREALEQEKPYITWD